MGEFLAMKLEGGLAGKHCSDRRGNCAICSPFINGWLMSDVLMVLGTWLLVAFHLGSFKSIYRAVSSHLYFNATTSSLPLPFPPLCASLSLPKGWLRRSRQAPSLGRGCVPCGTSASTPPGASGSRGTHGDTTTPVGAALPS